MKIACIFSLNSPAAPKKVFAMWFSGCDEWKLEEFRIQLHERLKHQYPSNIIVIHDILPFVDWK